MGESFTTCSFLSRDGWNHAAKGEDEISQNTRRLAQDYVQPCVIVEIDYTHKTDMPKCIVCITNELGGCIKYQIYGLNPITILQ